jgi:excisionase family DNA binding protein
MTDDRIRRVDDLAARRARRVDPPKLLSIKELVLLLGYSRRTIERMLERRELPSVEYAHRRMVRADHVAEWIEAHTSYGGEA